jgi:hypothetical protein
MPPHIHSYWASDLTQLVNSPANPPPDKHKKMMPESALHGFQQSPFDVKGRYGQNLTDLGAARQF